MYELYEVSQTRKEARCACQITWAHLKKIKMEGAEVEDSCEDVVILDPRNDDTKEVVIWSGQSFVHALSGATVRLQNIV